MIKVIIHKTCPVSLKLLLFLKEKGLLEKTEIIDAAESSFESIDHGVVSVPAIFVDDKNISMCPIDYDILYERITTKKIVAGDIDTKYGLKKAFTAALDSLSTAISVFFKEDIKDILNFRRVIEPLMGISDWEKKQKDDYLESVYNYFLEKKDMFMKSYKKYFFKNISKNFIRELFWLYKKKPSKEIFNTYTFKIFAHWLSVRSAIGRVGLEMDIFENDKKLDKAKQIYTHIIDNFETLTSEIEEEIRQIELMRKQLNL